MEFAARVQLIFVGLDAAVRPNEKAKMEKERKFQFLCHIIVRVVCSPIFILNSEIECCRCEILINCSYLAGTPQTQIATRKAHNMPTITRVQRRILNARSSMRMLDSITKRGNRR